MYVNYNGSILEFIKELIKTYTSSGMFAYLFAFFVCVIVVSFIHKKYRITFTWTTVIYLLLAFNPVSFKVFEKLGLISTARFYRFLWILPVSLLIAFVLTFFITKIKRKAIALTFVVLAGLLLIFLGDLNQTKAFYFKSTNIYKVPDNIIEISEAIHNDFDGEKPVLYYNDWIMMFYRTYDPAVESYRYRGESAANMSDEEIYAAIENGDVRKVLERVIIYNNKDILEADAFKEYLEGIDYIICEENDINKEYYETAGLDYMGTFGGYELYKNT